ncbi:unnamed protein product [Discula destructiva]
MADSSSSKGSLKERFVGKTLHEVPTPSIVLDLAKLQVNCKRMMDTAEKNGIGWRAHIKTHKTTELTRLQVGEDPRTPANIIVSTILEAENITPLLQTYQKQGRTVNVLYAFPLYPSILPRLAAISTALGPAGLSLMLDHPAQVPLLTTLATLTPHKPLLFLKINVATHRAGALPDTPAYDALLTAVLDSEAAGHCVLHGLYAHAGQSYYTRADWAALAYLTTEFRTLQRVAHDVHARGRRRPAHAALTLSVGATPTATALQHPDLPALADAKAAATANDNDNDNDNDPQVATLATLLAELKQQQQQQQQLALEVHAGVYPTLDLQQLATHARDSTLLASDDIAVSVVAEVASLYSGRGTGGTTEALINAGSLALGREPCQAEGEGHYSGWGMVMPWGDAELEKLDPAPREFPAVHGGWQVGRISQEHGILVWKGEREGEVELRFGQRVRVYPNHSCIAGAGFGHYLVVDSRRKGKEDEVVDVWERWNGW